MYGDYDWVPRLDAHQFLTGTYNPESGLTTWDLGYYPSDPVAITSNLFPDGQRMLSLQLTRGDYCVRYDDGTCMSDADANTALGFDPTQYFSNTWAGSLWLGSQWLASTNTGSMTGSQWAGSQWAGSQWAGSQWAGSQWAGAQWAGVQWASSPWSSEVWR